ncbi:hypothetical protein [Iamia sp.]|uniref:hypothetical protein n=1 Tax=Iamia sp. TaxID=2722710 RepID=UPI002C89D17A|nr:hypothetical protein [Iamia sp.]HXH57124.1 hypothetical protein [Iamia sp.]
MTEVQPDTGVDDSDYNLILLQQALKDCYGYQRFAADARVAEDHEMAELFDELATNDRSVATRARRILASRL